MHAGVSPTLIRLIGAAALTWAACALAAEDSAPFAIKGYETAHTHIVPAWSLSISGRWPTHCPPTLENIALDEHDLRIDARSVLELCERGATPFSIELNPALALQRGAL